MILCQLCNIAIVRVGVMLWLKTVEIHYNPQLGLPNKGCAIKELAISSHAHL